MESERTQWCRDEVILALAAWYRCNENMSSSDYASLSQLLNELPIIPLEDRTQSFRNINGISRQLSSFKMAKYEKRDVRISRLFFDVDREFKKDLDGLLKIDNAIRANMSDIKKMKMPDLVFLNSFKEGALLEMLHKTREKKEGKKSYLSDRCEICNLKPDIIYEGNDAILQLHFLFDPLKMFPGRCCKRDDFITLCPTCHEAVHRYRPWLDRENIIKLLK